MAGSLRAVQFASVGDRLSYFGQPCGVARLLPGCIYRGAVAPAEATGAQLAGIFEMAGDTPGDRLVETAESRRSPHSHQRRSFGCTGNGVRRGRSPDFRRADGSVETGVKSTSRAASGSFLAALDRGTELRRSRSGVGRRNEPRGRADPPRAA